MPAGPSRFPDPYIELAGAFLRRVLDDASGHTPHCAGLNHAQCQAEAQAFLRDTEALGFWVGLVGADVEKLQPVLVARLSPVDTGDTVQ